MKYLLVLAVIAFAIGLWRSRRRQQAAPAKPGHGRLAPPQDMVECAHCGLHLPRSEAVEAAGSSYCSAQHLAQSRAPRR